MTIMKTKKNSLFAIIFALMVGLLWSCKEDPKVVLPVDLKVEGKDVTFKAFDAAQKISVTANFEWTATPSADWIKVEVEKETLTIRVDPYNNPEQDRVGRITVTSTNGKETQTEYINVTQEKAAQAAIVLDPAELRIECEGNVPSTVTIIATVGPLTWTWADGTKPEWMNEPEVKDNVMTFTAIDNPTKEERSAKVILTVGSEGNQATEEMTVVQNANAPYIKIVPEEVLFDYMGTEQTFEVYYNTPELDDSKLYSFWTAPFVTVEVPQTRADLMIAKKKVYKVTAPMNDSQEERVREFPLWIYLNKDSKVPGEYVELFKRMKFKQAGTPVASISSVKNVLLASTVDTETVTVVSSIVNWTATSSNEWIEAVRKDDKTLEVKTKANDGDADRTGVVTLYCGTATNNASFDIEVKQAGKKSQIALASEEVFLSPDGEEKTIKVLTKLKGWYVEGAPEWLKVTFDEAKGTITLKVDKADAPRRADLEVVAVSGETKVTAKFSVIQNKKYTIGEEYKVNGKTVGIVYYTYNNGTNGYVFSLYDSQANKYISEVGKIPAWSLGIYSSIMNDPDEERKNRQPVCLDHFDGRKNLVVVKKRLPAELGGKTWSEAYPAMAWIEKFDSENGSLGWYIPAKDELQKLVDYVNGVYEGSEISYEGDFKDSHAQKRQQAHKALNKRLTELNGHPFPYDVGQDGIFVEVAVRLYSSTEVPRESSPIGFVGIHVLKTIYPWWEQVQHADTDQYDLSSGTRAAIRPILRF